MTASLRARASRLGSVVFLGGVVLLVLNDHVLKGWAPGWFTGKASDVAGVAVVGMLAAVVGGRRAGVVVTGVAWIALKTVPGVAELLAPVLGGPTRRDGTDLVASAHSSWCGGRWARTTGGAVGMRARCPSPRCVGTSAPARRW